VDVQTQVIKFFSGATANGNTKYDVYFADGSKASAFDYAIGAKAEQAWKSGEQIVAHITEKPNPNGGNPYRNLTGITLTGAAGAPLTGSGGQSVSSAPAGPQRGSGVFSGGMSPEDKIRVTKLSCISSAAAIFSGSGDVETTLEAAKTIFSAVWDLPAPMPEEIAELAGPKPQAVAEKPALPWAVA
jgi:hypothetical protein